MPSFLQNIINYAEGRIMHVPDRDVQSYVDTYNEIAATDGAAPISIADWRRMEKVEVMGATHHLIRQMTPRNLPAQVAGLAAAAAGQVFSAEAEPATAASPAVAPSPAPTRDVEAPASAAPDPAAIPTSNTDMPWSVPQGH